MPTVTASWNSETKVPRTRAGDASAMYIGPPTEVRPMPQPTRKRPAISVGTLVATAQRIEATAIGEHACAHRGHEGAQRDGAHGEALGGDGHRERLLDVEDRSRDHAGVV